MAAYYGWKSFEENEDRPEKPRRYGVTEMRGPRYSVLSQNVLQVPTSDTSVSSITITRFLQFLGIL